MAAWLEAVNPIKGLVFDVAVVAAPVAQNSTKRRSETEMNTFF
jgi:hypothetical protein